MTLLHQVGISDYFKKGPINLLTWAQFRRIKESRHKINEYYK